GRGGKAGWVGGVVCGSRNGGQGRAGRPAVGRNAQTQRRCRGSCSRSGQLSSSPTRPDPIRAFQMEFADLPTSLVGQLINHLAYPLFFVPATRSSPLPFLLF